MVWIAEKRKFQCKLRYSRGTKQSQLWMKCFSNQKQLIQQWKLLGQKHKLWAMVCNFWFHHHCQSQPDFLANKPATDLSCLLRWLTGLNERKLTRQRIKRADVYADKAWKIKFIYHCTYRPISNVKALTLK